MTTIKGLASELRTALEWASRYGAKLSPSYDIVKINATIGEKVALTQDEISHIYHFDLNTVKMRKDKRETLTRVRDAFVLACNIGWRFSDLCRIDPSFFDETHTTMTAVQQKTGDKARVDLQRMTIDKKTTYEILKRYNWTSPVYGMAISNYNAYLRTLTKLIPLEEEIKTEYKALGKIVVKTSKKNEMISSHTARRSYVTISVDRGARVQDIMRSTGHRSLTSFQKYYIMD